MINQYVPEDNRLLCSLLAQIDMQTHSEYPHDCPVGESHIIFLPLIKNSLDLMLNHGDASACQDMIEKLADSDMPFMLFSGQLNVLRNQSVRAALANGDIADVRQAVNLFEDIEEYFAAIYLNVFIDRLCLRNDLRLAHIRALGDKNLLIYFESHLEWLARLAHAVRAKSVADMPELDSNSCRFGVWLNDEGARLIRDQDHMMTIRSLHGFMHHMVHEISGLFKFPRVSGMIHAFLEKAENLSLALGNEIALLNSIVIMSVYSKDPLTGFLSRRFLDRMLMNQMEITKATGTPFCVIMFDLDHFKRVNDEHGHQTGDLMLAHVSRIVRHSLRQSDLIFRFGGEEFLLVASSIPLARARKIAEKLRENIAAAPLPRPTPLPVSASFGVVEVAPTSFEVIDARAVGEVVAACDARLYAAKRAGRNRVM